MAEHSVNTLQWVGAGFQSLGLPNEPPIVSMLGTRLEADALHPLWLAAQARLVQWAAPAAFVADLVAGYEWTGFGFDIFSHAPMCGDYRLFGGAQYASFAGVAGVPSPFGAVEAGWSMATREAEGNATDWSFAFLYSPDRAALEIQLQFGFTLPLTFPFGQRWLRIGFDETVLPTAGFPHGDGFFGANVGVNLDF
jgi:hypothetical protein